MGKINKTLAFGGIASFIISIVAIALAVYRFDPVMGHAILLIWAVIFGVFVWVVVREIVEERLIESESRLTSMSEIEVYQHKFDYLCPACLFQTNENTGLCPRCKRRELVRTYRHPLDLGEQPDEERERSIPL